MVTTKRVTKNAARQKRTTAAHKSQTIPLEDLELDADNPRLEKPLSQSELFARFAADAKTLKLATHIAANSTNPMEAIGVVKVGRGRYRVKEGNRRVAAIRLLRDPQLAGNERLLARYRSLRAGASLAPPDELTAIVFNTENDAHEWMNVKHAGQQGGVGLVDWNALQTSRFNARTGRDSQYALTTRLLDDAIQSGWVTEDGANEVNVSSLARVLNDGDARRIFQATETAGGLTFALDDAAIKSLVSRLIRDWSRDGGFTVRDIDQKAQRVSYATSVATDLSLPTLASGASAAGSASGAASAATVAPITGSRKTSELRGRKSQSKGPRRTLVPKTFQIDTSKAPVRLDSILKELQGLVVEDYPNAVALAFRLFVEASINAYLKAHNIRPARQANKLPAKLKTRAIAALDHLQQGNPEARQQLRAPRAALNTAHGLFAVATLNEYVHNPAWQPVPSELRTHWDNYSAFIALLWGSPTV